ncbi:unnamed protein product, partial [Rotaria sordida]
MTSTTLSFVNENDFILQFTDDTSMALCLGSSLIARRGFVPYDQLVRYKWWYKNGYMSSTGKCFDIGMATCDSLLEFQRRQKNFAEKYKIPLEQLDSLSDFDLLKKFNVYCSNSGIAGNGALMRLAPVPLFFYRQPIAAVEFSGYSGQITHGDQKVYDACRYYGALIVATLHGESKDHLLSEKFYQTHKAWFGNQRLHKDIQMISEGSFKRSGGLMDGIRGKGYIVNALEAALWAFWSDENSFEKGALSAVNLGDDADTTAAIYGMPPVRKSISTSSKCSSTTGQHSSLQFLYDCGNVVWCKYKKYPYWPGIIWEKTHKATRT